MKLNAVAVTTSDLQNTVEFYTLLGFTFPEHKKDEQHVEPVTSDGSARLMIDSKNIVRDIIGEDPRSGNHSSFAIEYDSAAEVNAVVDKVKSAAFTIMKEP